jgi:hypothetical protein
MLLSVNVLCMEAAVAEREVGMTEWNDGRLDDLSRKVDDLGTRMDDGFARVDAKFEKLEAKFDKKLDGLQRSLIQIAWTFGVGMLTFAGALLGVIAAKF